MVKKIKITKDTKKKTSQPKKKKDTLVTKIAKKLVSSPQCHGSDCHSSDNDVSCHTGGRNGHC